MGERQIVLLVARGDHHGHTVGAEELSGRLPAPGLDDLRTIDGAQLARYHAALTLQADAAAILPKLAPPAPAPGGAERAAATRAAAFAALPEVYQAEVRMLDALRAAAPGAILVGDSTQTVYAGNLYYDHDRPGGWFNAATGYGALGFGPCAAIGAALADRDARVLCLTGDGGLMFHPGELRTALDEGLNVTFVVFNNNGYGEIADAMREAGVEVIGCTPSAPDMGALAEAMGLPFMRGTDADLPALAGGLKGPCVIEILRPSVRP